MKIPLHIKLYLRSARGQLTLIAVVLVGAVVMAAISVGLRSLFFDGTIRQKLPSATEQVQKIVERITEGKGDIARVDEFTDRELQEVYGLLINEPEVDTERIISARLSSQHTGYMLRQLRVTHVVGNQIQRTQALELMNLINDPKVAQEALKLGRFALRRAKNRQEPAIVKKATSVIRHLEELF
ncbi:MAG: hypothetical protein CMJ78_24265 [Planctomycetaceae bacterium]|nr:hypothetical protein [Planctomycetaceae bacterium]